MICVVFAASPPYPTVFFACFQEIASCHRDQLARRGKSIDVSFEEFKRKDTFFARELLRQKGLEKLCEIIES